MRHYDHIKTVIFSIIWIIIISFCLIDSAFSTLCSPCLSACRGLGIPGCCTGVGCLCEGCVECETPTPNQSSPTNGLTEVPTDLTLDWDDVSGASTYDVRVCSDSACSAVAASKNVSASQWKVSPALPPSTSYWWQVRANMSCWGPWSTARGFTTICSAPPGTPPNLSSPANGLTEVFVTSTLDWDDVACASTYDVRVCSDSTCSTVMASKNVPVSQWQISPVLNYNTTYYWQVRAKNSHGDGSWSVASKFTTSSEIPLFNRIPLNVSVDFRTDGSFTSCGAGLLCFSSWKYYYVDIPSGATNFIVDLYNLSQNADLYVRRSDKPFVSGIISGYDYKSLLSGTTSEKCIIASPSSGLQWIGIRTSYYGIISYTLQASWDVPALTGDINNDGNITLADAIIALQTMVGMHPQGLRSDYVTSNADVNGGSKVGLPEVLYILQKAAGLR